MPSILEENIETVDESALADSRPTLPLAASVNHAALDHLVKTIARLERLFEQAQDQPESTFWLQMQKELEAAREQIERLRPH